MQNSSPILRWTFLARKGAKFIASKVTSLPSLSLFLSLSLSLSLCIFLSLSLSHRAHLTHNIRSASALPIIRCKLRCVGWRSRSKNRKPRQFPVRRQNGSAFSEARDLEGSRKRLAINLIVVTVKPFFFSKTSCTPSPEKRYDNRETQFLQLWFCKSSGKVVHDRSEREKQHVDRRTQGRAP